MPLLAFGACLAVLWVLHAAMTRIERMRPPKEARRPVSHVELKAARRPGR
jgi:hypothetical protein